MTFLAISAAIEWLEQHHVRSKELKEKREREKKELEDKALTVFSSLSLRFMTILALHYSC